jgi:hypothetical protein
LFNFDEQWWNWGEKKARDPKYNGNFYLILYGKGKLGIDFEDQKINAGFPQSLSDPQVMTTTTCCTFIFFFVCVGAMNVCYSEIVGNCVKRLASFVCGSGLGEII